MHRFDILWFYSVFAMFADVYLRRCRGQRLRPSEESAQTPRHGALQLAHVGTGGPGYTVLTLQAVNNHTEGGKLLCLYEPVIIGLGSGWLAFRGFESLALTDGGTVSFVQEWRCLVTERARCG